MYTCINGEVMYLRLLAVNVSKKVDKFTHKSIKGGTCERRGDRGKSHAHHIDAAVEHFLGTGYGFSAVELTSQVLPITISSK